MANVKYAPVAFICLIILIMVCIIGCTPKKNEQPTITITSTTTTMIPTESTGFIFFSTLAQLRNNFT